MHKCSSLWPPGDILQRSADNSAHERLHELTLEKQEGNQQRAGAHERGSRYDCPVKALVDGGEDRSSCRQRPCLDTVGCHERPEKVVPVAGNRSEASARVPGCLLPCATTSITPEYRETLSIPSTAGDARERLRNARRHRAASGQRLPRSAACQNRRTSRVNGSAAAILMRAASGWR